MSPPAAELDAVARALGRRAVRDAPLGARTTYRVGGTAALAVTVDGKDDLADVAAALAGTSLPLLVVGRGSNLLVADRGFAGVVVVPGDGFAAIDVDGTAVRAGAAVSLPVLARRTAAAGLTGLEWAVGVPGSVGGAVRMNAGGHGSDTARTLERVRWVDLRTGGVHDVTADQLTLGYRTSAVAPGHLVVDATFRLAPGDPGRSAAELAEIVRWRRANQPGGSNAGSVFTNPPGDSAGRLIEAAGLKGFRLGTATVSDKHANFIQADDGGSADDVRRLMDHVRAEVERSSGVVLSSEVRLVGFDGPVDDGGPLDDGGPVDDGGPA